MRLDVYLTENGYAPSRVRAKALIEEGNVTLDGKTVTKASCPVSDGDHTVTVNNTLLYVSRGGLKLEGALKAFKLDVTGKKALDIGASTGGFTDCLLQHGAKAVCAVDAGCDQLAEVIRRDPRVTFSERVNARELTLEAVSAEPFDLIVMDVSFISATYIIPRFPLLLCNGGDAIVLIKPQFEVGRAMLGKGGIVKDRRAHKQAIERVFESALQVGMTPIDLSVSPIQGGDGNREFSVHLKNNKVNGKDPFLLIKKLLG